MDSHIFQDRVPPGELVEHGPRNLERHLYVLPLSIWFNGPHEQYPPTTFTKYLNLRGWDRNRLLAGDWRYAHPDNANRSDEECILSSLSVIQSWLTLGFLESILGERVSVAKYTRTIPQSKCQMGENFR